MKRKEFLQSLGLAGAGALAMPGSLIKLDTHKVSGKSGPLPPNCTLIPAETAGPFPLDLTANPYYFRQDVREDRTGVQLNLKMKIIGLANCLPMQNVRVNIWHCDKDGLYSGYQGEQAFKYLRGYQIADVNGEVNFVTILPGWYPGRICHIHFQVYVSSVYAAVSQLTFPLAAKNTIYAENASLYTKGADPLSFNQDGVFANGYSFQLATLTPNAATGVYDSYLEVTVNGSGTSGLAELEPETGGQFKLGQNYPNPFSSQTTIPFNLTNPADVQVDIWDLTGKKVATLDLGRLVDGDHMAEFNLKTLGLAPSNYVYQLQVANENGIYRQCKLMTIEQ